MLRGSIATAPNGDRWRVGRHWTNKPLPDLRERFQAHSEQGIGEGGAEALWALDLGDSPGASIAIAVGAFLFCIVVLPLIGLAFELIVLAILLWSGVVARVFLGRPWIVEAVAVDDPGRREAFAVKGWRRSGRAIEELKRAIATTGAPVLNSPT